MLCDRCNINQATIHLENNINGTAIKADLCPQCAQLLGLTPNGGLFEQFFAHNMPNSTAFGQGIFGFPNPLQTGQAGLDVCPSCGTSFQEFQKTALFGCPDCYKYFEPRLASIFKRVQAGQNHVGRKLGMAGDVGEKRLPSGEKDRVSTLEPQPEKAKNDALAAVSDLEALRQAQAEAVAQEDYERAAQVRDRIKALQSQLVKISKSEISTDAAAEGKALSQSQEPEIKPAKARKPRSTAKKKSDTAEDKEG